MNDLAPIGHNNPPEPTPFELSRSEIEDLYAEARNWFDGEPITTQGQADAVGTLLDRLRKARKLADERRKEEVRPHDEAKAAIQERYNALIGDTKSGKGRAILAEEACKAALVPYLEKIEAEKRERARVEREEADRKRAEAEAAIRATREAFDLAAREAAERLLVEADRADASAKRADAATANAKVAGGRAIGLRTHYVPELADMTVAARHYWSTQREAFEAFLIDLARKDIARGKREIPGFVVKEERSAA